MNKSKPKPKSDARLAPELGASKILLVDDDERNLMALAELLKDLAEVVTATSGREALRHLLKDDFAVILLDVFMPGMDGYETARIIRQREQTARIPIIFLSAVNKETEHLMRGYAMGAVDYVFKPVDPLILRSKVGVFVDLYSMRAQVEEKSLAEQKLRSRLVHAQKMDAIGQLTGGIAHDFNNLLSAVIGGLHLLERRLVIGDREQLIVDQMRHAAEQGAELIRRMMAFARKQELNPTSVAPAYLCNSIAGLVEHTMGGTVKVRWSCADGARNIYADRSQLELAVVNLLINARDAMPEGGQIDVSIDNLELDASEAEANFPPGQYVRIRVSDQGPGIPDELIGRVTEPFFTTKEAGKGTGLGLSMVAGFVEQSHGLIKIDSRQDEGTTIDLILPATELPAKETGARPHLEVQPIESAKAVLLVDDDESVRTVLGEQLRELGFTVDEVGDGPAAIERLKLNGGYDVLLTDFAMPGMNGLDTIRCAMLERPSLQALLMTGYADEGAVAHARENIPIIRKPINVVELVGYLA